MTYPRARAEAVRAITGILHGRLAPTLDPGHVAGQILDALHDLDWRPVPRPHVADDRFDQARFDRGLARAKAILRGEDPDDPKEA